MPEEGLAVFEGYTFVPKDERHRARLDRFSSHLRQHTVQIEKTLEALGNKSSEIKRLWRVIYGALAEAEGVTLGAEGFGEESRRQVAAEIARQAVEIADVVA